MQLPEVHWEITNRCNLKCRHCYLAPESRAELTTHQIKQLMEQLASEGFLWMTLSGGEPLLRKDFGEIYSYAHNLGFLLNVLTSGTRISRETLELFKKKPPYRVEVTLNGITQATYETITQVAGSFAACLAGIRALQSAGVRLVLKSNGMTLNAHELLQIKEFATSLAGVEYKLDTTLMPRRNYDLFPTTLRLKPQHLKELFDQDPDMKRQMQFECNEAPDYLAPQGVAYTCTAGKMRFHISPWGDLHPCSTVRSMRVSLLDRSLKEAMAQLASQVAQVTIPKDSKCYSCKIFAICNSCPGLADLEVHHPARPVTDHCNMAQELMRSYGPNHL